MDGQSLDNTETSQLADFSILKCAVNGYINKDSSTYTEFKSDFAKIKSLNKHFSRMKAGENVQLRLILNNLVIVANVFDRNDIPTILFSSVYNIHWSELKTLLLFLNILPPFIPALGINTLDIPINQEFMEELKLI